MYSKTNKIIDSFYSDGYCIFENFLDEKGIDILLKIFNTKQTELKTAGIGKNENFIHEKNIRSDKIVWVEKNESKECDLIFFSEIESLIQSLNQRCFLGLNNFEFHFAKYEPGDFYKRHKDAFTNDDARKISVVLYLNKNWNKGDGGELNIYKDKTICVQPKAGTLVLFESEYEHEVLQSNKNRLSLTGWLRNDRKAF